RRYLEDEIIVVAPPDSELLQIKMRGRDAHQLVKVVKAVTDSYMDNVIDVENRENQRKLSLYEGSLNELKTDISHKRDQLVELQKRTNSADLETVKFQYEQLRMKSGTIMGMMSKTREDVERITNKLAMLKDSEDKGGNVPDYMIERTLAKDDQIADLTKQ